MTPKLSEVEAALKAQLHAYRKAFNSIDDLMEYRGMSKEDFARIAANLIEDFRQSPAGCAGEDLPNILKLSDLDLAKQAHTALAYLATGPGPDIERLNALETVIKAASRYCGVIQEASIQSAKDNA